jgi:hypothetical protein
MLCRHVAPLLYKVKPEVEKLLKTVCSNYLEITHIRKKNVFELNHEHPEHIIVHKKVYLGVSASQSLENLKENAPSAEIAHFYSTCISFYIELVTQI